VYNKDHYCTAVDAGDQSPERETVESDSDPAVNLPLP